MMATVRRLAWEVTVADPSRWTPEHRERARACLDAQAPEDWVMGELVARMAGAAEAFMHCNPDLFAGSLP